MASRAPKTLRPQDEVSHYRVIGPLGAGGMGEVYLAQDLSLERRVALKILPPDLVRSEERLRRFMLEARSASSLSHPNIVTIYEIGSDEVRSPGEPASDSVHFISMELVTGHTLSTLIHEEKTDLRTLLGYLAQAAEGLAKAHAAGIVHRDLKPGNIMVSADGFAKVLDFGLAKLTERRGSDPEASSAATMTADGTSEGMVVGTAGYMSPEQVQGKPVDARSDIFSFGCILYEAATRRHPFRAETTIETLHRILNVTPSAVEELNPKAPADLRRLIRRCLAKNPEQRLQSMKDLALELRDIVNEYESLSASGSSGSGSDSRAAVAARRSPSLLAIAIGSVVLVGAAALIWWGSSRRSQLAGSQAFENMEITTVTNRGDVSDCTLSADGRYLAYLAGPPGQLGLRVRQVATGSDVEVLPSSPAAIERPAFSPDGNYLFYLMRKPDAQNYRALYQVPSLGGTPQQRVFDVDSRVTFSPDGKQVAFWRGISTRRETDLIVADLDTGKERTLASVSDAVFRNGDPSWSPDGKRIAAAQFPGSGGVRTEIALFDVATGRRLDSHGIAGSEIRALSWLRDGSGLAGEGWASAVAINSQLFLIGYPDLSIRRITNDFSGYYGVSTSAGDEAVASLRRTTLANIWMADDTGAPARQVTRMTSYDNSVLNFSKVDSSTLVMAAPRDKGVQVFALDPRGAEPTQLTTGPMLSVEVWGAAGKIAMNRVSSAGMHVWSVNQDGSGLTQLTSGSNEQMRAISPDGRWVLYWKLDSLGTLSRIPSGGGPSSVFATNVGFTSGYSPSGERVMVGRSISQPRGLIRVVVFSIPASGGAPTDSLLLPGQAANPGWSGDSRGILFEDATDPVHNVYVQRFGEAKPTRITSFTEGQVLLCFPSRDGKHLAMSRRMGASENVWVCGSDGSRPLQVTQFTTEHVFALDWMPDNRHIVIGAGTQSSDAVLVRKFR